MASDASRRFLDGGIWSCRIKLPNSHAPSAYSSHAESSRAPAEHSAHSQPGVDMAPSDLNSMDVPLESTSPSSRRNKGKLAEALHNMSTLSSSLDTLDLPTDPDAQATVTDFLDFTEYLPSDMVRSLTLIGNLDHTYAKASAEVHDLTKVYGQLPSLPADKKPDPTRLRANISQNLGDAVSARTASFAEACRMVENVERHYNRIKNIHAKLLSIADAYPSSRESSPLPQKPKSPVVNRALKIMLRVGNGVSDSGPIKPRKHRAPRITVPGEVLAPYELDYESYGSESDGSEEDQFMSARETPARSLAGNGISNGGGGFGGGRIRLKVSKPKKERVPKPLREDRPPGFGTNVHSQIAGISTSNALKLLAPPPSDAKLGSEHLPWLALSEYELGVLRKKMKKNAVWSPSDTMINRELQIRGRGMEAYRVAQAEAKEKGETIEVPPQLSGGPVPEKGALSTEAVTKSMELETPLMNRGMKLNEAKKLKRENQKKELEAAEEGFEEAQRKAGNAKAAMENLFGVTEKAPPVKEERKIVMSTASTAKTPSKTPARKRKREIDVASTEGDGEKSSVAGIDSAARPSRPLLKRTKTETPVPVPQPIAPKQSTPALSEAAPSVASLASDVPSVVTPIPVPVTVSSSSIRASTPASITPSVATSITPSVASLPASILASNEVPPETPVAPVPVALASPKKSSTPILPPVREPRKIAKKEVKKIDVPTASSDRPRRSSAINTPITSAPTAPPIAVPAPVIVPIAAKAPTPAPEPLPSKRPTSSRSKAASIERDLHNAMDRPRRASTARNTPAPEPRQPSKRTKRPAPGIVTKGSEDATAVSVGKRSAATRKKAGPKKEKKDGREGSAAQEEVDDEGNLIDPNEPRYCLCNRVSFGTMIGCENNDCEKEWFHLECVNLTDIPPRTTKWYCPECRVTLGIGEKGEVNARGKKK